MGVPLGEIARRAGVGPGTVYRHFPTKEALFRAAVQDRLRLFADTAADVADAEDPGGVFFRFLASVVRLAAPDRALCEALSEVGEAPATEDEAPPGPDLEFLTALGILLARAQQAGAVREDVDLDDVRVLLAGCLTMERRRSAGQGAAGREWDPAGRETDLKTAPEADLGAAPGAPVGRMTALMLDSLRAGRNVTELPSVARNRNETRCRVCGTALAAARTGRPARYCGGACRQKAHRARRQVPS
ncbi:TetR family transcriptional regulator [Streptomyces sp. NRRL F-4489]|uniref:TetR/AcrR family transcriptional regulator n=1 Tax=Streptomyces sp. NRRL F-4489 TaxID=1609095 RepID=UPI000745FE9D|nr:TetR family transcriptional regulator [Streptomyces sp. NRRL F-4489]